MPVAPPAHLGIVDLAGVAARSIAVESVLFEAFGRWVATTSEASAKPRLAAASRSHAWHAELWRDRYPLLARPVVGAAIEAHLDVDVAEARAALDPLVAALATFDALSAGAGRLAAVGVAAAAMAGAYRDLLEALDPRLDAPTARVLTLILADLADLADRAGRDTESGGLTEAEAAAVAALTTSAFPSLLATASGT